MASNSIEDPSFRQELEGRNDQTSADPQTSQLTKEEKRKMNKRKADRKYRQKKKAQVKTLREQNESYEQDMKLFSEPGNELKEIVENLKNIAESQNDANRKNLELLKQLQPQILGGSICATTNDVAYPQVELTVTAMKSNGSFVTESFKACQSLPEEWARPETAPCGQLIRAFYGLKEHYTASTRHLAEEIARLTQEKEKEKRDQEKCELELEKLKEELARARAMHYENIFADIEPPRLE